MYNNLGLLYNSEEQPCDAADHFVTGANLIPTGWEVLPIAHCAAHWLTLLPPGPPLNHCVAPHPLRCSHPLCCPTRCITLNHCAASNGRCE